MRLTITTLLGLATLTACGPGKGEEGMELLPTNYLVFENCSFQELTIFEEGFQLFSMDGEDPSQVCLEDQLDGASEEGACVELQTSNPLGWSPEFHIFDETAQPVATCTVAANAPSFEGYCTIDIDDAGQLVIECDTDHVTCETLAVPIFLAVEECAQWDEGY
jgi:hypothetical protein